MRCFFKTRLSGYVIKSYNKALGLATVYQGFPLFRIGLARLGSAYILLQSNGSYPFLWEGEERMT